MGMSHKAVNWALEQRHLKPSPWRVLVMLADRHNKDTLRVDPDQALIAWDCNMSRSSINRHLEFLEEAGLLVRVQRVNPKSQKQINTFYVLGIDFDNPPHIEFAVSDYRTRIKEVQNGNIEGGRVSNSDTGAVSQKTQIPCPKKRDSRVSNSDTNNHVKEPVKEPCVDEPHTQFDFSGFLEKFKSAYPRVGDVETTADELRQAIDAGTDPDRILAGARAYAEEQRGNNRQYIAYSENWIRQKRWERYAASTKKASRSEIDAFTADLIKCHRPELVRHVSPTRAAWLVDAGLVSAEDCAKAGVRL